MTTSSLNIWRKSHITDLWEKSPPTDTKEEDAVTEIIISNYATPVKTIKVTAG